MKVSTKEVTASHGGDVSVDCTEAYKEVFVVEEKGVPVGGVGEDVEGGGTDYG